MNPSRESTRQAFTANVLDLLVVGGGIVGSGIARDAAMRGLAVGLVDRHDFSYGTSSRSSRLLHGGLRYLEQGEIGLVREASLEKRILHRIAPHLSQPLGFIFPAYAGDRPLWQLRIGVLLYDLLCNGRNFQPSSGLGREATLQSLPALDPTELRGSVRYFDALTNDARLTLDTLRSAAGHGAHLLNYTRFVDARREDDLWVCQVQDASTNTSFTVRSRTIVNATGPWSQAIPHSRVKLRLTKGIHLVIDRRHLPSSDAVVITEGRRILFVIPWGERIILGTTDTDYEGEPERVATESEDIDYVLRTMARFFPSIGLTPRDAISSWAGLRPLVANEDGSPSDVSRTHEITTSEPGWWDVTGGKLTTYRLMAEQTVDRISRHLGRDLPPCRTAQEPLLPASELRFSGILPPAVTQAAVAHYLQSEWAVSLTDVMVRRSGWHYYHPDAARQAEQVADWMADLAGWSASHRAQELAAYRAAVWSPTDDSTAAVRTL